VPYNIYLLCFSKDIDKQVYISLASEALHYPEKSSKALDEPGRVGEGCEGTAHYIYYCSSLLSYTYHRQLQPYKF